LSLAGAALVGKRNVSSLGNASLDGKRVASSLANVSLVGKRVASSFANASLVGKNRVKPRKSALRPGRSPDYDARRFSPSLFPRRCSAARPLISFSSSIPKLA
jgi:hypothetical protein